MATAAGPQTIKVYLFRREGGILYDEDTAYTVYSPDPLRKADVIAAVTMTNSQDWAGYHYDSLIVPLVLPEEQDGFFGYYTLDTQEQFEDVCAAYVEENKTIALGLVITGVQKG